MVTVHKDYTSDSMGGGGVSALTGRTDGMCSCCSVGLHANCTDAGADGLYSRTVLSNILPECNNLPCR